MRDTLFKLRILFWRFCWEFKQWKKDIWQHDLDERWCCDGKECMCGGETIREQWSDLIAEQEESK